MGRVLSARFSLELTTFFPLRQSFSLLLDRCPRLSKLDKSLTAFEDAKLKNAKDQLKRADTSLVKEGEDFDREQGNNSL